MNQMNFNNQNNHAKYFQNQSSNYTPEPEVQQDISDGDVVLGPSSECPVESVGFSQGSILEKVEEAPKNIDNSSGDFDHAPFAERTEDIVSMDGFKTYIIPVQSTDYTGLESIDARLVDREWRLNNLYTVIDEEGNLVRFKLREAQKKLLRGMHYKNIILKARQLGFTTFICIFLLDYALFNSNKQIGIIGPTQTDTSVIFRKVKIAWDNFSPAIKEFLRLKTLGDSKVEYEFTNGSVMRISTSLRSGTYQAVLITEFGKISARFPEKAEEIITGTLPAVPAKGLIFIESTAEGEDGRYHEMVEDAMENKRLRHPLTVKEYKFFFFPWYENPSDVVAGTVNITGDVNEYLDKMENMTNIKFSQEQRNWYFLESKIQKGKMKQEHPTTPEEAFLMSGNKLFNAEMLDEQKMMYMRDPIEIQGDFLIYKRFMKGHLYGLGADVSQGVRRDSSTIVIIDFTTGDIVLTYKSNTIDPVNFAHDIKKAALMYGGCIAAPEANNVGITTCVTLNSIYSNIYTQQREGYVETSPTNKLGWLTTGLSKPKMMYEFSEAVNDDIIHLYDEGILMEAKKFNKEDSLEIVVNEKTTRHFDLLTAAAIAYQMKIYTARGVSDPEAMERVEKHRANRIKQVHRYS